MSSTWVVKDKPNPITGEYERTKARLTPHGFKQRPGINYDPDKTAAPTLHVETFHLFMAFATLLDLDLFGLDVVGAFTIPKIKKLVVLSVPYGVKAPVGCVLPLVCNLYRAKQAAYDWYQLILVFMIAEGFSRTTYDRCLFFKWVNAFLFLVVLCVDDHRGGCKDSAAVEDSIKKFHAKFPSTDQDAGSFLGVLTTKRFDGGYFLSMRRYFENL
jgi:hypothetical protein